MSELGDLLEVVHGAHRSFRSMRLEVREWRDDHRLHAGYARAAERARAETSALGGPEVPAETEVFVRAWFEQPNRVREEREEAGHRYVAVADGARWWQRLPAWATTSAEGDGTPTGQVGRTLRPLLDPWPVIAGLELALEAPTEVAGRDAVVVSTSAHPQPHLGGPEQLAHGADGPELAFDRERGILLGTRSFFEGEPFSSVETLDVAFDERLPDGVAAFEAEAGEEVVRQEDVSPGDVVTVEEAARRASFTVLVPRASRSVSLRQRAGPWHRVLLEEQGTFVELDSQTVATEALVERALALVPAPTEPPPLVA